MSRESRFQSQIRGPILRRRNPFWELEMQPGRIHDPTDGTPTLAGTVCVMTKGGRT